MKASKKAWSSSQRRSKGDMNPGEEGMTFRAILCGMLGSGHRHRDRQTRQTDTEKRREERERERGNGRKEGKERERGSLV